MLNREPDAVIKTKPGKVMKVWVVPSHKVPEGMESISLRHLPRCIDMSGYHYIDFHIVLAEADDAVDESRTENSRRAAAH